MADQATDAFKAAWAGRDQREAATLVKIELTRPSSRTLYLSGREEVATPGSPPQVWEGGLIVDGEPILSPGSLRESSWAPSSCSFTLVNDAFNYQTGANKVLNAFAEYGWIGAAVTFYLWEKSLTDFADAVAFKGFVVQDYEIDRWLVTVRCIKRFDWNRECDLIPVTRKRYPRAPEESLGKFIPKIRGAVREIAMRMPPWAAEYDGTGVSDSSSHGHAHLTGGRRATPGVVVDAGGGGSSPGTKTRIAFASHACKRFFEAHNGCIPYIDIDGKLCLFDPLSATTFNDATDGAGLLIGDKPNATDDPFGPAFYPLPCVQIEQASANNAENPRAALDIANDTSYAVLDYDAGYHYLWARLPSVGAAGDVVSASYCIIYSSVGSMANVVFRAVHTGGSTANHPGLAGSTTPLFEAFTPSPFAPTTPWAYGDIKLEVYFTGTPTGVSLKIYGLGAIVKFRPKREVVGRTEAPPVARGIKEISRDKLQGQRPTPGFIKPREAREPVYSYAGAASSWYTTLEGYADSGGTYTGNGTDLIQRAPDLAHHVLVVEGAEVSAKVTTAASTFGSFVDARANLKTWRQSDMVHALVLTEPERVADALERLGRDSGCWFYLSEFDDKWKCVVWKAGAAVDGLESIEKLRLAAPPRLRPTPGSRRETGVRVMYGHDHFRGHPIHECSIGPGRSNSSHKYRNLRDQQLTVISSGIEQNNKLDFHVGVTDYIATLTAANYSGMDLAQHIASAMNSAFASDWVAGYGPTVVEDFNDAIRFGDGSTRVVQITPGAYATMEALATAVAAAMNSISSNWSCTYSRTTRKLTIGRTAGTCELLWTGGIAAERNAMALLGYKFANKTGSASYEADYEREEERYHIGNLSTAFNIEWETGTNGTNGNNINCATLIGFDPARDSVSTGSTDVSFYAVSPVKNREQTIATRTSETGEREPITIAGETIYDHDTAREVRDRATDLLCVDRPEAEFLLVDMPWVERGRVYGCTASVDELIPYAVEGSDQSWVGKKFRLLSKAQHIFGSYVTELTAVETS